MGRISRVYKLGRNFLGAKKALDVVVRLLENDADKDTGWKTAENGKHYHITKGGYVDKGPNVMKGGNVGKPSTWETRNGSAKSAEKKIETVGSPTPVSKKASKQSVFSKMAPARLQSAAKSLSAASGSSVSSNDLAGGNVHEAEEKAIIKLLEQSDQHTPASIALGKYIKSKIDAAGGDRVLKSEGFRKNITAEESDMMDAALSSIERLKLGSFSDGAERVRKEFRAVLFSIVNKGLGGPDTVDLARQKWDEARGIKNAPKTKEERAQKAAEEQARLEAEKKKRQQELAQGIGEYTKKAEIYHVSMSPVRKLAKPLTHKQIVTKIAKEDRTDGSCVSSAFAYIANKMGFDVKDFKGGNSQKVVGNRAAFYDLADSPGVKCETVDSSNDHEAAKALLSGMKPNKEYLLVTGKHASVVRLAKDGKTYEFLELQSKFGSGYQSMGSSASEIENTLKNRFGCRKSRTLAGTKITKTNFLFETDSLYGCKAFGNALRLLNTA